MNGNRFRSLYVTDNLPLANEMVGEVSLNLADKDRAFLPNRLTTAQRDALDAIEAMLIYNTDDGEYQFYDGSAWTSIGGGGGSGGIPQVIFDINTLGEDDGNNFYITSAHNGKHILCIGNIDIHLPNDEEEGGNLPRGFTFTVVTTDDDAEVRRISGEYETETDIRIVGGDNHGNNTGWVGIGYPDMATFVKIGDNQWQCSGYDLWDND